MLARQQSTSIHRPIESEPIALTVRSSRWTQAAKHATLTSHTLWRVAHLTTRQPLLTLAFASPLALVHADDEPQSGAACEFQHDAIIASLLASGSSAADDRRPKPPPAFFTGGRATHARAAAERSLLNLGEARKTRTLFDDDGQPVAWVDVCGATHEWRYENGVSAEPLGDDPFSVRYGPGGQTSTDFITADVCRITATVYENGAPIRWPWETPTAGVASPAPRGRAFRHDDFLSSALDAASADGKRGSKKTGVKRFAKFCRDELRTTHERPIDPATAPLWALLEEERLVMRWVCSMVEDDGIAVDSAAQYVSQAQGWHAREFGVKLAGGLKLSRLPEMMKGLRRLRPQAPRKVRRGFDPERLAKAMDALLDPAIPLHANIRAAIASATVGLLRSREYTIDAGEKWNSARDLARADIGTLSRQRAVLMIRPCKNMHHLGGKTCPLILGGGATFIDAPKELINLLAVDPVPDTANSPLFRDPSSGRALRTDEIHFWTKRIAAHMGEDPDEFGTHSFRITGATALFAAGATETVIRTLGRWSSDLYRLYVRACFEQSIEWTRKAGSTKVSDVAASFDEVDDY